MSSTTPTSVKISFWILLISLVLDAVTAIVFITSGFATAASPEAATALGANAGGGVYIATGVVTLILVAIELIILWKMRAGRNWARIVITILEILALGSIFAGFSLLGILGFFLSIVALVLLWVPASNNYFRR
jgi:hypothetical protein